MKKKIISLFTALVILMQMSGVFSVFVSASNSLFHDVKGHWAEETIIELASAGIISGRGDGIYDPNGTVTRAEFMKLLTGSVNAYSQEASFKPGTISDVFESDWYYRYVASGLSAGIVDISRLDSNRFKPNDKMLRGEVAIWISRALGIETLGECPFYDIYDEEVKKAVITAANEGIVTGYGDGTYKPDNTLTRAEAAVLVKRVMTKYEELNTNRQAKNTAEYTENVVMIENDGKNILISADESGKLEFSKCNDTLKSLKSGQILYIKSCDKYPDGGVLKVEAVEVNGDTVKLQTSLPALEKIFSEIDISKNLSVSPENYVYGSSDVGITLNTDVADLHKNPNELLLSAENLNDLNFDFSTNVFNKKVSFSESGLSGSITIKSDVFCDLLLQKDKNGKSHLDLELISTNSVSPKLTYKSEAAFEKDWKLGSFKIRVYGPIVVYIDLILHVSAEGEFEVTVEAAGTNKTGISVKNGSARLIKSNKSSAELNCNAEGTLKVGPDVVIGAGINCLIDTYELFDLTTSVGVGVSGKTSSGYSYTNENTNTTSVDSGITHICVLCIDGEIFYYLEGEAGLNEKITDLLGIKKLRMSTGEVKFKISDWYYSYTLHKGAEFDYGNCPNMTYKTTITAVDSQGNMLAANVSINGETQYEYTPLTVWLPPGTYTATAKRDGYKGDGKTFTITDQPTDIKIVMQDDDKTNVNLEPAKLTVKKNCMDHILHWAFITVVDGKFLGASEGHSGCTLMMPGSYTYDVMPGTYTVRHEGNAGFKKFYGERHTFTLAPGEHKVINLECSVTSFEE